MAFSTYLFDLDGTLIDSVELILSSFRHTRQVHFGDRLPDEDYIKTMGTPLREAFRQMTAAEDEVEAMVRTYVAYNLGKHDAMVRPYPGINEMVRSLSARGARLGIVTSKMKDTALRGLRVAGLESAFSVIVGFEDAQKGKPDPEPVHRALEKLGAAEADTVFVGDSPHDVIAGNRAGVKTAAATWGPFSRGALAEALPSYWLDTADDILAL